MGAIHGTVRVARAARVFVECIAGSSPTDSLEQYMEPLEFAAWSQLKSALADLLPNVEEGSQ